jgi:hypothetical protein
VIEIQELSPEESAFIFAAMRRASHGSSFGCAIKGFFDVVCRNPDGGVDWEIHQSNIQTDYGRRVWADRLYSGQLGIFTSPVGEVVLSSRYCLADHSGQTQISASITPTIDSNAITKTVSNTFGTPAANRQLAVVGLASTSFAVATFGATAIMCYSLINPVKTQTTIQSLEVSYRLTLQAAV